MGNTMEEKDYKRLYLEQKIGTLELEISALQTRYALIQIELPQARKEWAEHTEKVKQEKESKKENKKEK